jgi:monofunctional biosynthetic peptidoglycan transglycosylase
LSGIQTNRLFWKLALRTDRRRAGGGSRKRSVWRRLIRAAGTFIVAFYALVTLALVVLRWANPPTTAVQTERRIQSWVSRKPYRKTYIFVPLGQISPALQHAVVAAEDARFFQHHGFDWKQVEIAVEDDVDKGKRRGASTITQQLVKNLFLGTSRSFIRKGVEFTIVPIAEMVLSKNRILELYLNVIEWGPGVYGGEAAAQHYYRVSPRQLRREEAIELASILPAPLRRKPGRLTEYDRIISERMAQMGW